MTKSVLNSNNLLRNIFLILWLIIYKNEDFNGVQTISRILLHPTSLPGKFGIGELGSDAINFVNFWVIVDKNCGKCSL